MKTLFNITAVAGCPHLAFAEYLRAVLPKAVRLIPNAPPEISVSLVGAKKMAALHLKFMNVAGPTDVLTFELDHDPRGRVTEGEIVICVPVASREAKRHGVSVNHELLLYGLHGVLHLSGYDDLTMDGHSRMHEAEDRILKKIGVGAVFHRSIQGRSSKSPRIKTRSQ